VQADITHWPDFNKIFDACEKKWNDVPDAYGICAGLFEPPFSNFWLDTEEDEGYKQVDVNVNHPIKLTRMAVRKSLGRNKRASVCIIVSNAELSLVKTQTNFRYDPQMLTLLVIARRYLWLHGRSPLLCDQTCHHWLCEVDERQ
jgi:NAD(P)-dependent dehydrogenase (short-subunit alcohol dehydrogenase family)